MLLQGFIDEMLKIRIFRSVWLHSVSMDYGQVNYCFCLYVPFLKEPRCDEVTLDNKAQPSNEIHDSYAQAQKIHAAMTKSFSHEYSLGLLEWHQTKDGMVGNPSISPEVANYMSGLHH